MDDLVQWSGKSHMLLNMNKTRALVIDFRRKRTTTCLLSVLGHDFDIVQVPGHPHSQQVELEDLNTGCT